MALVYADRVQETTTTTGTGTLTLAGAVTGYQTFAAVGNANTCIYALEDANGSAWETGVGTYTASGTTLARTAILASSNSGSAINLSAGTHKVYVTLDQSLIDNLRLQIKAETVTTGNITGEVGTQHVCTIAGLTANRDFVLPATCKVGDRVSVSILDGDADYELLIKPAAGDTINGGSAGEEWSRLFLAGEVVTLRCVTANSAWIVEQDRRFPCYGLLKRTTAQTFAVSTTTLVEVDSVVANIGSIADIANYRFVIRRNGKFLIGISFSISAMYTPDRLNARVYKNGDQFLQTPSWWTSSSVQGTGLAKGFYIADLQDGDLITLYGWTNKTGGGYSGVDSAADSYGPFIELLEIL